MKTTTQTRHTRPYTFTVPGAYAASEFTGLEAALRHAWHAIDAGLADVISIQFAPSGDTLATVRKGDTIR
jgi:hypothetical protein